MYLLYICICINTYTYVHIYNDWLYVCTYIICKLPFIALRFVTFGFPIIASINSIFYHSKGNYFIILQMYVYQKSAITSGESGYT